MSMYYADYVNALGGYLPENVSDTTSVAPFISGSRYNTILPRCIEYAEGMIYRDPDLDFLANYNADGVATNSCVVGRRKVSLPGTMLIAETVNIITPAGYTPGSAGSTRNPLVPTSVAFINNVWPNPSAQQQPTYFARDNDASIILGAYPDQAYTVEFYGTLLPAALSNTNTSTLLTLNFPELFIAASMIYMTGYQKNFGAMAGDPQEGMTWQGYYDSLKKGVGAQEARKKLLLPQTPPSLPAPPPGA